MEGFDVKIGRLRERLPQWRLAQALGISPTDLCAIENGRKSLTKDMAERIMLVIARHAEMHPRRKPQESWEED